MKTPLILCIALLCSTLCFTQNLQTTISSAYLQQEAYGRKFLNPFSISGNQAVLAQTNSFSAGIYTEKRFMLNELSFFRSAIILPAQSGNFGFTATYFGSANYNQTALGLAYGKKLSDKVDVGVQFNYYHFKAGHYGRAGVLNADAGVLFHFTDNFSGGIQISNPAGGLYKKSNEAIGQLPFTYSVGFGYTASDKLFLNADMAKQAGNPLQVNAGIHYRFDDKIYAKGGISAATAAFYMGIGMQLQQFRLDAVANVHPYLGFTPGLLIIFKPMGNEAE